MENRRQLLRALGAVGIAGLAGCLSRVISDPAGQTTSPTRSMAGTAEETDTSTPAATPRCPPTVTPGGTTPSAGVCPPPANLFLSPWQRPKGCDGYDDVDVTTLCSEAATTGDVRATVSPSTLGRSGDLTVALHNESNTSFKLAERSLFGFPPLLFHWYRGHWTGLFNARYSVPASGGMGEIEVPPGETEEWTIRQEANDLGRPLLGFHMGLSVRDTTVRLPPGVYAVGFFVDGTQYTRRFEVTGDPLALRPSNAVVETIRQDDTLIVRRNPAIDDCTTDQHDEWVTLVLDRRSSIPDRFARASLLELYNPGLGLKRPGTKIPARVPALLRDAFAHDDGSASQIRVETPALCRYEPNSWDASPESVPEDYVEAKETIVYEETAWQLSLESG